MASTKHPKNYSTDEVCVWLNAIGLGDYTEPFRDSAIDGGFLVTLGVDDLKELGLTGIQSKKLLHSLEIACSFADAGGLERIQELEAENAALRAQLAEMGGPPKVVAAPAPAPAPKQQQQQQQQQQHSSHHQSKPAGAPVLRGAAGGAARGAVLGAVAGAIAGDAGKGAKMGAAVGGTAGGMQGLGARRRARLGQRF